MDTWQFTPYALLYLTATGLAFALTYLAWKMRPVQGATLFSLMMLFTGIWTLGYLLGFFNTDLGWKLIMLRVEYLGIICASVFWLLFVASYAHYDQWLTWRALALLTIIPVITLIQLLAVQQHGLFYRSYDLTIEHGLVVTAKAYGPGFYLWMGYAYFTVLAGVTILVHGLLHMPDRFRGQVTLLVLVAVAFLFPSLLYVSGNNPVAPYDPTPLSFVIVGVLFVVIIYRYRFLDVVPVAHSLVFKNVNSGVIIIDERTHILEMNPAAEHILGCTQKEILGKPVLDVFPEHRDLITQFQEVPEIKAEIEMGQDARTFEIQTTPLIDRVGHLAGRIIMLYDITERKRALDELDAYARTVAHDLKSPLGTLLGFAELLEMGGLTREEQQRSLRGIGNGALKMRDIIDGLLLLASVRNREKVKLSPLDTDAVVSSAVSRLSKVVAEKEAQISQPEVWPVALCYAPWVEEIWVNYLSNALKYGGSPPVIELGAGRQTASVRFWVRDNGPGLSAKEQANLFTEFTRLERHVSSTKGHGLGLSIVQRIASKLGGEAGIESKPGQGNTFFFTLPCEQDDDQSRQHFCR